MTSKVDRLIRQPLLAERPASETQRERWVLLLAWLAVTVALAMNHVPWRDEARAWSLMQMGQSWPDMFRTVQGEGHPYLWYILLRLGWDLFRSPDVLRVLGPMIGVAAAALLALRGPFRIGLLALLVFSPHLGFEYTVLSRNYGISALMMFAIAALWPRIRDSMWLGVLLFLLCNTNVPSVFIAGTLAFYRMLELTETQRAFRSPEWRRFVGNGVLLLIGVALCFLAVYPPANDAAANSGSAPFTLTNLVAALFTAGRSFMSIGFGSKSLFGPFVVLMSLLLFLNRPKALSAALLALIALKLFFFFVYPGHYRHSSLFFILLVALAWIEAGKGWAREWNYGEQRPLLLLGSTAFAILMGMQTMVYLRQPIADLIAGRPFSHAAALAQILERPELRGATLMIDPDTMGESVVFQNGRPYWLTRQDRPATLTPLSLSGNKMLTLDRLLQQADAVSKRTGRPVLIALALDIDRAKAGAWDVMYHDYTVLTPASVLRFKANTRKIASLRNAGSDEEYDVYLYPR